MLFPSLTEEQMMQIISGTSLLPTTSMLGQSFLDCGKNNNLLQMYLNKAALSLLKSIIEQ